MITLSRLDLVFILSIVGMVGGWAGVLWAGFGEVGDKWKPLPLVVWMFLLWIGSGLTLLGTFAYALLSR